MNSAGQAAGAAAHDSSAELLHREIDALRSRLREAEETLEAIRNGDVDAVVVSGADEVPRVYTLETADQSYRLLVEEMQEGALTLTRGGDILYCNASLAEIVAAEPSKVIGGSLSRFFGAADWQAVLDMVRGESKGEVDIRTERGGRIPAHVSFSALRGADFGRDDIYCCIVTDLTAQRRTGDELRAAHAALLSQVAERERTERLLRHSQKMDAVGQLTGGIAHDFNNLLMVITGGLSILSRDPSPERRRKLQEGMRQAAERGAALTRQLLAFSRQKELHPKPIAIPRHIEGMRELLDGSLGGAVTVRTAFDPDVWPARVDEGELQTAILNLCVNARDAMPQGGVITISACNRPDFHEYGLTGDFVQLSVTDTGEGMDAETIARCLEPFYTTKDIGKGSGLGLAQVYGFARGSGGYVQIESQCGQGTRVLLLLPRSQEGPSSVRPAPDRRAAPGNARDSICRVLLVEDDAAVSSLTNDMLLELGYEVVQVASAQEGLNVLSGTHGIGIVLSDVMMPGGMDGISFIREMRRRGVSVPAALVSGFPEAIRREADKENIPLLAKPYALPDLAETLSLALATRHETAAAVARLP